MIYHYKKETCNESMNDLSQQPLVANFDDLKQKLHAYINVYDGKVKTFKDMESAFESLFHEEFVHTMDGKLINRDQMRETVKIFLSAGTYADLTLFKPLDGQTFEVKLLVINKHTQVNSHSKGTVKDGKIIKLESYEDSKRVYKKWQRLVQVSEVKHNFESFIQLQNCKDASSDKVNEAFDTLFYDILAAAVHKFQLYKERGMRTTIGVPDDFDQVNFSLEKCEIIDDRHIEVKVVKESQSAHEVWHDILKVKDGAIVKMIPYKDTNLYKISNKDTNLYKIRAVEAKYVKKNAMVSSCPPVYVQ